MSFIEGDDGQGKVRVNFGPDNGGEAFKYEPHRWPDEEVLRGDDSEGDGAD